MSVRSLVVALIVVSSLALPSLLGRRGYADDIPREGLVLWLTADDVDGDGKPDAVHDGTGGGPSIAPPDGKSVALVE